MASGKLSTRQKMINLMYLVFIAMLALNISKEVLTAVGRLNERLEASNIKSTENNTAFLDLLKTKGSEDAAKYEALYQDAQKIKQLSQDYYDYLEGLKRSMVTDIDDPKDYQVMDKSDYLDKELFQGDNLAPEGKKFMAQLNDYREQVLAILGDKFPDVSESVRSRFETGDADGKVEQRDGVKVNWINYHFEGFPLIASLTKLTSLQADIKSTEEDALRAMLQGELTEQISLANFSTLLETEKSAFYSGETFSGSIVLGRTDKSARPVRAELNLDGRKLSEGRDYELQEGGVKMLIGAGNPGDHEIAGTLFYMQDGEEKEVPVKNSFSTISKPNTAVISADKMNVVYRGVPNPMTISIPAIPDNKVSASAPGLSKRSGSKYVMNPGTGRNVTITASGTLPDGQRISTKSEFRIKDIPRPTGSIRGETGSVKMPKQNLEISTVGAILEDFDFDLTLHVKGFKFKVPGQPTVIVNGDKLDSRARDALKRARRGDAVQIFDIQAEIANNRSYKLKKVSPVIVELNE